MGHERGGLWFSHVVDEYNRYPGDKVTFYTRVEGGTRPSGPLSGLTLYVRVPEELELLAWQGPAELPAAVPDVQADEGAHYVVWTLADLPPGARYDYQACAVVRPGETDRWIESEALLCNPDGQVLGQETVTIAVRAKGRYLRYLPELYDQDELMGRFLMLFESFWKPIEGQINQIDYYLDPRLAPPSFLPWLASWLGQDLDGSLSEGQRRRLVGAAVSLARMRGTRQALQTWLEVCTGGEVEIIEHRRGNMVLGAGARLGVGIALGTDNRPHTLDITVRPPPVQPGIDPASESHRKRLEQARRRTIEALIESQKPAHVGYRLIIKEPGVSG